MRKRIAIVILGVAVMVVGLLNGAWVLGPYAMNWGVAIFVVGAAMAVFAWPGRESRKQP